MPFLTQVQWRNRYFQAGLNLQCMFHTNLLAQLCCDWIKGPVFVQNPDGSIVRISKLEDTLDDIEGNV